MGRDEMRAADADRQAVADNLKSALDEGRLDLHEYDERLQQAYAAKTYGDLKGLLADLPQQRSVILPAQPGRVPATNVTGRWIAQMWGGYLSVVGITIVVWLVSCLGSGELNYFWPVWVAGPWGVIMVVQMVTGLSSGAPQAWQAEIEETERKKLAKQERKQAKLLEQQKNDPESTV